MIRMKRRGPKHLQRMRLYGQKHRRRRRHRTRRHRKQKRHIRKHRRRRHRTQRRRKQKRHIRKHRRPRHRTRRRRKQKRRTRKHRRPRRLRHLALVSRSRILPCSMSATHMYGAGQVLQKGQTVPDLYRPYLQISGCICPELQSPSLTAAHQLAWTICSRVICCSIIRPEASTM